MRDSVAALSAQPLPTFPIIVGRGRSGTSLLRVMLTSHPELAVPFESHFLVSLGRAKRRYERPEGYATDVFVNDLSRNWGFKRWGLQEAEVLAALRARRPATYPDAVRTVYQLYAQLQGKSRYGDKTPIYVLHVAFLAELFPEAKFVHVIRDGRDVALSYLDASWGPNTVEKAAWYWRRAVRRGQRAGREIGPGRYMEVRYEDLVDDPARLARTVCEFIDLDFAPAMLRYYEDADRLLPGNISTMNEHQNLRLPPTKGLRDWRRQMSNRDVALFESIAGTLLTDLGYERGRTQPPLQIRARAGLAEVAIHGQRVAGVGRRFVRRRLRKPRSVPARTQGTHV